MVPGPTWQGLTAFRALTRGRGGLRESEPVEAVPRAVVDAVLPHLPPILRTAVELLWWSGMRASELCNLRMRDVERGDGVWLYRPAKHKGTWKGRERVVRFGPRCIELLRPMLSADPGAHFFTAAEVMRQRKAAWRAARKTKVQPSQQARDSSNARKAVAYAPTLDVATLRRAVHRACDDAGVERWGLHRLRHAAGTRLVLEAGDDAARVQLGHADGRMVRRYSVAADAVLGQAVAAKHA
jgi:integrase